MKILLKIYRFLFLLIAGIIAIIISLILYPFIGDKASKLLQLVNNHGYKIHLKILLL